MTGSRTVVRLPESLHAEIRQDVALWGEQGLETFLFLVLTQVETMGHTLYIARSVIQLDAADAVREPARTRPTEKFTRSFYGALLSANVFSGSARLAAVHSHPFCRGRVAFSGIDLRSFSEDARIFAESMGGVEFVALVFDRDTAAYDGLVVNAGGGHGLISEVQVVGRRLQRLNGPAGGRA